VNSNQISVKHSIFFPSTSNSSDVFGAFCDLICWFHYLMKWFLFSVSWFYDFSLLNFQSPLSPGTFCSDFVSFYALLNHNQSFLEWFLMFPFVLLAMISFYDPQIDAVHSNCHLWLINLSWFFRRSIYISFFYDDLNWLFKAFLLLSIDFRRKSVVGTEDLSVFFMRKVDLELHVSCEEEISDDCYELMNQLPKSFWELVSFPTDTSPLHDTLKLIIPPKASISLI
jgi:hypothetical protein